MKIDDAVSVCLTTDSWTSASTDNFMAVTAHFIDDSFLFYNLYFSNVLSSRVGIRLRTSKEVAKLWNLQGKVVLTVTDNVDSVLNTVKDVVGWKHLGCFAYRLNLVVKGSLNLNQDVVSIIDDVKRVVSHFKRSCKSSENSLNIK